MESLAEKFDRRWKAAYSLCYDEDFEGAYDKVLPLLDEARASLQGADRKYLPMLLEIVLQAGPVIGKTESLVSFSKEYIKEIRALGDQDLIEHLQLLTAVSAILEDQKEEALAREIDQIAIDALDEEIKNGTTDPVTAKLMRAQLAENSGDSESARELLGSAFDQLLNDDDGDALAHTCLAMVSRLAESENYETAIAILEQALKRMKHIYSASVKEYTEAEVKTWVMDPDLARKVVLAEDFQNLGLEPNTMLRMRRYLMNCLQQNDQRLEAIEQGALIDAQLLMIEKMPEPKFDEIPDEAAMMPRDLLRADFEIDEESENGRGVFHFTRAGFYNDYGAQLHIMAQKSGDKTMFESAEIMYNKAKSFLHEEGDDREEFIGMLYGNLQELKEDMAKL